jgi:hypothetical protein
VGSEGEGENIINSVVTLELRDSAMQRIEVGGAEGERTGPEGGESGHKGP